MLEQIIADRVIPPQDGILRHKKSMDSMPANIELSGLEISPVNIMSRKTVLHRSPLGGRRRRPGRPQLFLAIDVNGGIGKRPGKRLLKSVFLYKRGKLLYNILADEICEMENCLWL